LLLVELLVMLWPTSSQPGHAIRIQQFLTGPYAWAFLPVLILGITAFTLLSRRDTRHKPAVQITAAAMYVFAIFLKRYSLMAMGFGINSLGQPTGVFVPSLLEVVLALGILSLGMLIMTAGAKVLPLVVPADEHHEERVWVTDDEEPALEPEVTSL
jgi:Ni/Fe-hydrogenase subunit HybB-like protein